MADDLFPQHVELALEGLQMSGNVLMDVVLLGDALHTAHYSIGSGTKLAMEDAIALYEAPP